VLAITPNVARSCGRLLRWCIDADSLITCLASVATCDWRSAALQWDGAALSVDKRAVVVAATRICCRHSVHSRFTTTYGCCRCWLDAAVAYRGRVSAWCLPPPRGVCFVSICWFHHHHHRHLFSHMLNEETKSNAEQVQKYCELDYKAKQTLTITHEKGNNKNNSNKTIIIIYKHKCELCFSQTW